MSRGKTRIAQSYEFLYGKPMIMIFGILLGLVYGFFRGQKLGKSRADRVFYVLAYGLVGFTSGIILTFFIQIFADMLA